VVLLSVVRGATDLCCIVSVIERVGTESSHKSGTAPAQVALEPQVKTFTEGLKQPTIYQGISDDVDRAWGELYNRES
jgi:hypothetical protein